MATQKKSSKPAIIKTVRGEKLELTPTRLVQIDHPSTIIAWYTRATDIKEALDKQKKLITIREVGGNRGHITVGFLPEANIIGCCEFSTKTFRQILRHFGLRKTRARAAKAGA